MIKQCNLRFTEWRAVNENAELLTAASDVIQYLFTNIVFSLQIFNLQYLHYFFMDFDKTKTRTTSVNISFQ